MRVLVTGATGFVGQHLVSLLIAGENETAILVREAYGMGQPLPASLAAIRDRLQVVYADLRNYRLTGRALQQAQPDVVFHLAAAGVADPFLAVDTAMRHNVAGAINLVRATFKHSSTGRVIVARTPGEAAPANTYQASKAAAWSFCQMYARQMRWSIYGAAIFQTYGPGQQSNTLVPATFAAALRGQDFPMTSGTQQRDWIYVDDVVAGLAALAKADFEPATSLDIGTGKGTTVLEVVNQVYALVGRGGRPLPGALSDRPGEQERQVADSQRTNALLGWQANTSISEGLRKTLGFS